MAIYVPIEIVWPEVVYCCFTRHVTFLLPMVVLAKSISITKFRLLTPSGF